jgi:hypothetical protein
MSEKFHSPQFESFSPIFGQLLVKNSFATLWDLAYLFQTRKIEDGHWERITARGNNFPLHDYGCGLYSVSLLVNAMGYFAEEPGKEKTHRIHYCVLFHIGCADDGEWQAWSKYFDTEQEAITLAEKLVPILDDLSSTPTEAELNEMLKPFGLWGQIQ